MTIRPLHALIFVLLVPAVAHAEPRIEVLDRGEFVEVIGHEIKSSRTNLSVARQRIEVPLAAMVPVKRAQPTDPTVMLAEIDPDAHTFSVKLAMDHGTVLALAKSAQAQQIGDDLHVIFPRKVPAEGTTVTLPEPTLPVVAKPLPPPVVIAPPLPDIKPTPKVEPPKLETKPEPAAATPPQLGTQDESTSPTMMIGGLALMAGACGIWLVKRRKKAIVPNAAIDVIAQKALGGRARVVWLAVGQRELLVAVTPQSIRPLGEWPRGEAPQLSGPAPALPRARTHGGGDAMPRTTTTRNLAAAAAAALSQVEADKTAVSPAITGILRLRNKHAQPLADDIASGSVDEDATWARELLAATNARGAR